MMIIILKTHEIHKISIHQYNIMYYRKNNFLFIVDISLKFILGLQIELLIEIINCNIHIYIKN